MPRSMSIRLVSIFVFTCCLGFTDLAVNAQTQVQPGQVLISELRLRGPAGVEDEFIEIYNNTDSPLIVQSLDGSAGWAVVVSNGQITGSICVIPNGTEIPARGHFLCANSNGYSLSGYPSGNPVPLASPSPSPTPGPFAETTPNVTWGFDVGDGSGVALFGTTNGTNFTAATRLDAFGFTSSPALFREGNGFASIITANTEHTYYRDLRAVTPKDTNDNAADFRLVGTAPNIQVPLLGAPGPENLNSPTLNNNIPGTLLDPSVAASQVPNRERRPTGEPNADLGTILIRRTMTNNTGLPVSRLRFRVIDITTLGTPPSECAGCADVRALTSFDGEAAVGGQLVTVRGVRLEEPPTQAAGGGLNASVSADFITFSSPLLPGHSVNIEFKLGVMRTGAFRFYVAIEAQNGASIILLRPARKPFTDVSTGRRSGLQMRTPTSGLGGKDHADSLRPALMAERPASASTPQAPAAATWQPFVLRTLAPAPRVESKKRQRRARSVRRTRR
ncbi:MAG TPA: lamin tail domain-containing protein [Pyrinomonadaceae bacterium]|nr:lamin tail domain-containing protein [Pyrinomonadaceae bacterium]